MTSHGEAAFRTMAALDMLDDEDVAAHVIGTIYELAMRSGKTPRTIADNAFTSLITDQTWRNKLEPALREALGRDE